MFLHMGGAKMEAFLFILLNMEAELIQLYFGSMNRNGVAIYIYFIPKKISIKIE